MGAKARRPSSESDEVGRGGRILRKVRTGPAVRKKGVKGQMRGCPASKKKDQGRIPLSPRIRRSSSRTSYSISSSVVSISRGTRSSSRSVQSDVDLMEVVVDLETDNEQQEEEEEEEETKPIVKLDTKNYCLFCYRECEKTPDFALTKKKGDFKGTKEEYTAHIRSLFFKRVACYLKFDFGQGVTDQDAQSLLQSCLNRSTEKGRNDFQYGTCNDCMTLLSSFCELHQQNEIIRFHMEDKVRTLSRIMKTANRHPCRVGPFKQNVLRGENAMGKGEKEIMKCFRKGVMRCKSRVSSVPVVPLRRCDKPAEVDQMGQQEEMEINDNLASAAVPESVSSPPPPLPPAEETSPATTIPTATSSEALPASPLSNDVVAPEAEPMRKSPSPSLSTATTSNPNPSPASTEEIAPEDEPVSTASEPRPPAAVEEVRLSSAPLDEDSGNVSSSSSSAATNPSMRSYPIIEIDLSSDDEDEMDLTVPLERIPASIPNHDPNHSAFEPPQNLPNGPGLNNEVPNPAFQQQQRNIAYVQPVCHVQQHSVCIQPNPEPREGHQHRPQPPPNMGQNPPPSGSRPGPQFNEDGEELLHELTARITITRTARSEPGATRSELMRAMMNPETPATEERQESPQNSSSESRSSSSAPSEPYVIECDDEEEEERNRREAAALRVNITEVQTDDDDDDDDIVLIETA